VFHIILAPKDLRTAYKNTKPRSPSVQSNGVFGATIEHFNSSFPIGFERKKLMGDITQLIYKKNHWKSMKLPSCIKNCWVIIKYLFDRYGHNRRSFFNKITLFSKIQRKEIIIFVDKFICFLFNCLKVRKLSFAGLTGHTEFSGELTWPEETS